MNQLLTVLAEIACLMHSHWGTKNQKMTIKKKKKCSDGELQKELNK